MALVDSTVVTAGNLLTVPAPTPAVSPCAHMALSAVGGCGVDPPPVQRARHARHVEAVEPKHLAGVGLAVKRGLIEPSPGGGDKQRGKIRSPERTRCRSVGGTRILARSDPSAP